MKRLADHDWPAALDSDAGSLAARFYVPILSVARRYDRSTGYFSAKVLTLAARGVEGLVRNGGHMRLVVGCTLGEDEVRAIEEGLSLREAIERRVTAMPLDPEHPDEGDALELLAWMVAQGHLDVKVAVPCTKGRKPWAADGLFHEKAGIVEDGQGARLAFNGSVNETAAAWTDNWESFHVFTTFGGEGRHVESEERKFARLWADRFERCRVIDVPAAVRDDLLRFLPPGDAKPKRLPPNDQPEPDDVPEIPEVEEDAPPKDDGSGAAAAADPSELRRLVWGIIRHAPAVPGGGELVGEATSAVTPWPHQVRTFQRLWDGWPPKLLLADEVGLGKTIEAGLLLREAWLSGRAKRILVLAPKAVLRQWQLELREKFNLRWPIYDGHALLWPKTPAAPAEERPVARDAWHREPCVLVSSQLIRRRDRAPELLEQADPWDLVVLDEAHHARRRAPGSGRREGTNLLLRLMRGLEERTRALLLLTATPMQVHPVEIWDLLSLLGLPPGWDEGSFLHFFEVVAKASPSHDEMEFLAARFREAEACWGEMSEEQARRLVPELSRLAARKVLAALRSGPAIPRRQLAVDRRHAALRLLRASTPVARLVSRPTRELLRRYQAEGKLASNIATRRVQDEFIDLSSTEQDVYQDVEEYISSTYDRAKTASGKERNAIGFVMTIYRRRLASSFYALEQTLKNRLGALDQPGRPQGAAVAADDVPDDEFVDDEALDEDQAEAFAREALVAEERDEIARLLGMVRALGRNDTKAGKLLGFLEQLREAGYAQAMVFTQYADTMDFLRGKLLAAGLDVACYSGRGGELPTGTGDWRRVSRDRCKQVFQAGGASVLLCTDAASEGLNFQFCGALINYDMPWNPMRVEQRIGRIDRVGQAHEDIRVVNLHYRDTVEADVYEVLRERIDLFETYVGRFQPILAKVAGGIEATVLSRPAERDRLRAELQRDLRAQADEADRTGFDLDKVAIADLELPPRPAPWYDLDDLDRLLRTPTLLPPGVEVQPLGDREYSWLAPGMDAPIRVTTKPSHYDAHPESVELWSPGNPLFPDPDDVAPAEAVSGSQLPLRRHLAPPQGAER